MNSPTQNHTTAETAQETTGAVRAGRAILGVTTVVFIALAVPVLWRSAPLADDFNNCVAGTELGLGGFLAASWHQLGAIRPARFLEILVTVPFCGPLPFGVVIVVPLLLTLAVAWMARGLLRDLGIPEPWADVGGALWLLQPLGTEAGLWPAALHVPLGLALALAAARLYGRGRHGWGAAANLAAALSVEQVIFPMPLVAWLIAPAQKSRRATVLSVSVGAAVVISFLMWPGANPRLRAGLVERIMGLGANPGFYVGFSAVGLGLHSIPLAVWWALPWSILVLALGGAGGSLAGPHLAAVSRAVGQRDLLRGLLQMTAIIVLANIVVVFAVPQQGSPRVFAPTWLVMSMAIAAGAAAIRWSRPRLMGAIGGLFGAGAILSLALSVSVRLHHADFTERAAAVVASRVSEGGRVAICGVRRTVVPVAPRGAFAVHEFIYDWAAERAVVYYTGRHATIYLAGDLWNRPCPKVPDVDVVIDFDELLAAASR